MLPLTHRSAGALALLGLVSALSACGAHRVRATAAPDARATWVAGYDAADMLNRAIERQRTLARIQDDACPPRASARSRVAALREARVLVKRAQMAPASEQPALERRARELLERIDGF